MQPACTNLSKFAHIQAQAKAMYPIHEMSNLLRIVASIVTKNMFVARHRHPHIYLYDKEHSSRKHAVYGFVKHIKCKPLFDIADVILCYFYVTCDTMKTLLFD